MDAIKIGFVPAHRNSLSEDWASELRQRCLAVFSKIPGLEIIVPDKSLTKGGFVRSEEEAEKVIRLFQTKGIDGLIIGTMTFGDEISINTIATAFRDKPQLLFGTKENEVPSGGNRISDSFCGTLSISSGLHRRRIHFIFAGLVFPEEKEFQKYIVDFVGTCSVVKGFIGAKIGLVGPRPESFETCIYNEDAMIKQFNQRVVPAGLVDVMLRANGLKKGAPELRKIEKEMRREANLSSVSEELTDKFARLEYSLKQFAGDKGLSAMAIQCYSVMEMVYGIAPCYVMGRLTSAGMMASCEVDLYGALAMLVQYKAALSTTPPHFMDWTLKHPEERDTFLAWHCGNGSLCLSGEKEKVAVTYHYGPPDMGTVEFQLKSGVVTLSSLQEDGGKFKMLVTGGESVKLNGKMKGSWSWVRVPELGKLYRTLITEGFVHHASLIHGDYTQAIMDACTIIGIEVISV
jgi:L-fucose isomerase-like protein